MSALSSVKRWLYYAIRFSLRIILGRRCRDLLVNRLGISLTWKAYTPPHAIMKSMIDWEPDVSSVLRQMEGDMFIDVGCNIGYFLHLLKNNFKQIIGFEADPEIAAEVQSHAPPNARIHSVAISDKRGFAYMHRNPQNLASGASIIAMGMGLGMKIPSAPLSDYVPKGSVVDLIKVDAEGAEWLVLKGAEPIMKQIKRWMIELHDLSREQELESYLKRHGYETSWLKNGASLPHVFATRT